MTISTQELTARGSPLAGNDLLADGDVLVGTRIPSEPALGKRTLDVVVATVALVVALPLLALIAALIKLTSRGPVLFRQERFGVGGTTFTILKFRTMVPDAHEDVTELLEDPGRRAHFRRHGKVPDDPRVTRLGRVLRLLSLDELPQLVNVIRGDMSLVGPRPRWTTEELTAYGDDLDEYLSVLPGLTGPWQVSGRNRLTERERVALDLDYVESRSMTHDLLLLLATVPVLLWPFGRGAG